MNQTDQLVSALKRSLKARGLTYRDVAEHLGLSEASVKRIFSERSLTLKRLEQLCELLQTNVFELARMTQLASIAKPRRLTLEQEQALADDPHLLTHFFLVLAGWTHRQICKKLQLSEPAAVRRLAALDRLKLIELLPRNKVRLLTAHTISWRRGGPVHRRYEREIRQDFLDYRFNGQDETLHFLAAELSDYSIKALEKKFDKLVKDVEEFAEVDMALAPAERRWFGIVVGARPWMFVPEIINKQNRRRKASG